MTSINFYNNCFYRVERRLREQEELHNANELRLRDELWAKEKELSDLASNRNMLLKESRERMAESIGRLQDHNANRQAFEGLGSQVATISGNLNDLRGAFSTNSNINTLIAGGQNLVV